MTWCSDCHSSAEVCALERKGQMGETFQVSWEPFDREPCPLACPVPALVFQKVGVARVDPVLWPGWWGQRFRWVQLPEINFNKPFLRMFINSYTVLPIRRIIYNLKRSSFSIGWVFNKKKLFLKLRPGRLLQTSLPRRHSPRWWRHSFQLSWKEIRNWEKRI